MDTNNNFNIKNIRKNIINKFNVKLSKATIYFVLHKNNLTYKKMYIKNIPTDNNKLLETKNYLKTKIKKVIDDDINLLISYDEMSIYLHSKPYKGWSKKGKACFIKTKIKSIFKKLYTLGMCINYEGIINFTITEKH